MGQPSDDGAATRFEATIHTTSRSAALGAVDALDLDRVPDPDGGVRLLVGPAPDRHLHHDRRPGLPGVHDAA